MLIWATTYPITDVLLVTWDPLSLGMTRVLGAGILLGLIAIALGAIHLPWRDWPVKQACLTGAVGMGLGTVLMNFGFLYSNPVNVAVIANGADTNAAGMQNTANKINPGIAGRFFRPIV